MEPAFEDLFYCRSYGSYIPNGQQSTCKHFSPTMCLYNHLCACVLRTRLFRNAKQCFLQGKRVVFAL